MSPPVDSIQMEKTPNGEGEMGRGDRWVRELYKANRLLA